jgi:hypothetical protein
MGPIRCPETSVNNYHTTPCNNPEDHIFQSLLLQPRNQISASPAEKPVFSVSEESVASQFVKSWTCRQFLVIFEDCKGIVHQKFVCPCPTISSITAGRLAKSERASPPETSWSMANHDWSIHYDNTAHTSLPVQKFLASKYMDVTSHPPNLPELASCCFIFLLLFLFLFFRQ